MSSLQRKYRRKKQNQNYKAFKKTIKNLKSIIKCSVCGRPPSPGETIDDWLINTSEESMDLVCAACGTEAPNED